MNPRSRRLAADWEGVRSGYSGHPSVQVEPLGAMRPPEMYRVVFRVPGLRRGGTQPTPHDEHIIQVRLSLAYPREPPYCVPLTPIFHPNISAAHVCIGDYWSAGQPLGDVIAKIGAMIQFQIYNVDAPVDATAARWTIENERLLPIGHTSLAMPEPAIELGSDQTVNRGVHQSWT